MSVVHIGTKAAKKPIKKYTAKPYERGVILPPHPIPGAKPDLDLRPRIPGTPWHAVVYKSMPTGHPQGFRDNKHVEFYHGISAVPNGAKSADGYPDSTVSYRKIAWHIEGPDQTGNTVVDKNPDGSFVYEDDVVRTMSHVIGDGHWSQLQPYDAVENTGLYNGFVPHGSWDD